MSPQVIPEASPHGTINHKSYRMIENIKMQNVLSDL